MRPFLLCMQRPFASFVRMCSFGGAFDAPFAFFPDQPMAFFSERVKSEAVLIVATTMPCR